MTGRCMQRVNGWCELTVSRDELTSEPTAGIIVALSELSTLRIIR